MNTADVSWWKLQKEGKKIRTMCVFDIKKGEHDFLFQ